MEVAVKTLQQRTLNNAIAFIVLALMVACLSAGVSGCDVFGKPQTFEQQLAYAYGTHTSVLTAAANAVEHNTLSVADATQVLSMADDAKIMLDASRAAIGVGDVTTAEGQLKLATNVLQQLLDYLNARVPR
jgi:hypothetical protein